MPGAVVALVAAAGVPGLVTAAGGLTTVGSLIAGGLGIGLSIVANLLFAPQQKRPKPADVKGVVRGSVTPRQKHYGELRVGGSLVFIETFDGDLYQIFALNQGEIESYETFYIDENVVTVAADGWVQNEPYNGDAVRILTRPGSVGQTAQPVLLADFPTIWTADHRLRGIAYCLVVADTVDQTEFNEVFPNRYPVLNAVIRSTRVFDPRNSTTAFTANLALCLRDYIISSDGARVSPTLVDGTLFSAAADVCDEQVTTKDGAVIPRYHGALTYSFDAEPVSVIQRFAAAMDARVYLTPQGRIGILAGEWIEPTVTIEDQHVLEYDLEDGAGPHRSANEIIVKYTQVEAAHSEVTADPWRDEDDISISGDVRSVSPELYEVQNHNQARRLAKLIAERANPRWTGTVRVNLKGMDAFDQRFIRIQITDLGIDDTFEVNGWQLDVTTMTVVMTVQTFAASAYTFDAATEEGTAPAVPEDIARSQIPTPSNVTLASEVDGTTIGFIDTVSTFNPGTEQSEEVQVQREATVNTYALVIGFDEPPSRGTRVEARYREVGAANWSSAPEVRRGQSEVTTPTVKRGRVYEAQVRYSGFGRASDWEASTPSQVTIPTQ